MYKQDKKNPSLRQYRSSSNHAEETNLRRINYLLMIKKFLWIFALQLRETSANT